ncbi:MAG: hypothetical protein LBP87_15720 [Planctomycetaceae bacterium]|jgi:hypothetical protein|nr:hypothetical protein [Planctomycetaceae bacterium]
MSTNFYPKKRLKNKLSKRILGMESLENRELLSINPLGIDDNPVPDFVQTADTTASRNFIDQSVNVTMDNIATNATALRVAATRAAAFAARNLVTPLAASTSPVYSAAVTDAIVTPSGATTDQVTITWGKPTKFVKSGDANNGWKAVLPKGAKYSINIFDSSDTFIRTIDAGTKTSYTITGLPVGNSATSYKFTVTTDLTLTNPSDKTASAVNKTGVVAAAGEFKTLATGDAVKVTVGPPTDVKATYAKASGTKPANVKVAWKPPANYNGGYKVTLSDGTNTITRTINPGSKLEITQKIGDAFNAGTGDFSDAVLAKNTRIKIVVTATATNNIPATPTYVNTGTIAAAGAVAPAQPGAPTTAALANTPGGTTVTLTANGTETTNKTVGFYVGVTTGTTAPAKADVKFTDLVYVPKSTTTTINLKVASNEYVYAFAVGTDGTISATGSISAAVANITSNVGATDATNAYPATKNVKGVTATADPKIKNKYTVKWTAASDHFSGTATASAPKAAGDFKYEVTGYRVTATIKNGAAAGPSKVIYVAKGTNEAVFENLTWNTKYDFNVEALVTYTTAQNATTWNTTGTGSAGAGVTKTGVAVAKAPTVTEDITAVTQVSNSNTGNNVKITLAGAKDGALYIVTVTDANKAILYTGNVTGSSTGTTFDFNADGGLTLTPKAKYTVTVQTVGSIPGMVSKGKTATINATDFMSGTLKDAKGTTINTVKINVSAPSKGAGAGDLYYIEYTNAVDAKGKPDWNAAKVWLGSDYTGDPEAVKGDIQIGKLAPNSQYFFRIVTTDAAYSGGWSGVKKVVASKELKIKTATVPQATITKNGFTLDSNSSFGLKLVGNSMARVDGMAASAKQQLGSLKPANAGDPLYVYTIIASVDNKTDKATGQLVGAAKVTNATVTVDSAKTSSTDKKVTDLVGTATFADIFSKLGINDTNFSSVKGLNIQIQVDVYYGDANNGTAASPGTNSNHFTMYSKASKIALPKWFV